MVQAFVRAVRDAFVTLPISNRARIVLTIGGMLLVVVEVIAILLELPGTSWDGLIWVAAAGAVVAVAAWVPTLGALLTLGAAFASSAGDVTGSLQFGIAIVAAIVARTCTAAFMTGAGLLYIGWAALAPGGGFASVTAMLLTSFSVLVGAVLRAAARRNRILEAELVRQEEQRRSAVAAERTRIAIEMHDVVAHALTVIAMHASVLERTHDLDERERSQRAIGEVSRQAVEDMRTMLSALHAGNAERDSNHGTDLGHPIQHLEALAASLRTAGIATTTRLPATLDLPAPLMLAVVRIAQEATTNILKHAPQSAQAVLEVAVSDQVVVVLVENTLPAPSRTSVPPSGFGLMGLQERTKLFGGALTTGQLGDTWSVRAELPLSAELEDRWVVDHE